MRTFLLNAKRTLLLLIVMTIGFNSAYAKSSYNTETIETKTPCHHGMVMAQDDKTMIDNEQSDCDDDCCDDMDKMQCSDDNHDCSQCTDCVTFLQNIPFLTIDNIGAQALANHHTQTHYLSGKAQRLHFFFERPPKTLS